MAEEDKKDVPVEKAGGLDFNWKERVRIDQMIVRANPYAFGLYVVVAAGALAAVKYYLRFTLSNSLFSSSSNYVFGLSAQEIGAYWLATIDVAFWGGLVALVVLPIFAYYKRHGLRQLGVAMLTAFLLLALILAGFWSYLNSVYVQPQPQLPAGLGR